MHRISINIQNNILYLRKLGKSIPEIHNEIGVAKTTIQRYVKGVKVPEKYLKLLKEKQGGSKDRAKSLRENVYQEASKKVSPFGSRDKFFLLLGLYWGEGTKKDFSMINSDPVLVKTFINCLSSLGISHHRLEMSLRIHREVSLRDAKRFWSTITGISEDKLTRVEVIDGKKKGKLKYGMCRVRIKSGIRERLLIQSAIDILGKESMKGYYQNAPL